MKNLEIKNEIKRLSEEQIFLKNQRKTIKLVGERKMDSYSAILKVQANKDLLRHLFEAYAIIRGKERLKCVHKEINEKLIQNLILKYTFEKES